ncbi:MAG: inorganic phosphate transporter [Chlamydiae bacterium]|nr:inorganic phosphate transporter [Chlamydiota bacterium]
MDPYVLAILIVVFGLLFDYTNGFHDAANVVSTVIATKVLKPLSAIVLACVLNTIGATNVSAVAQTITSGLVDSLAISQITVLAALLGAIAWNFITWYFGIPSSSSYALVGGLIGATWQSVGPSEVIWKGVIFKVGIPMLLSPVIGYCMGLLLMKTLQKILEKKRKENYLKLFGNFQIGSASIVALAHGLNDAQKSMGIITLGLFASNMIISTTVPFWVVMSCAIVMGLGTASGGVRIIKTVGFSITKLETVQGFAAEMSASVVILIASCLGMPVSSTHMIVGSVTGVGAANGIKSVRWEVMKKMAYAWIFTIPLSAIIATIFSCLFSVFKVF